MREIESRRKIARHTGGGEERECACKHGIVALVYTRRRKTFHSQTRGYEATVRCVLKDRFILFLKGGGRAKNLRSSDDNRL